METGSAVYEMVTVRISQFQRPDCGQGMVFAINSDESSDRNLQAFQDLAKKLNGTGTGKATSPSSTSTSSAVQIKIGSTALVVVLAAFPINKKDRMGLFTSNTLNNFMFT